MAEFRTRIAELKGQAMTTVRGRTFSIDAVGTTSVIVTPASTGKPRSITRAKLEKAATLRSKVTPLRPVDVQANDPGERNSAYIAALINALYEQADWGP